MRIFDLNFHSVTAAIVSFFLFLPLTFATPNYHLLGWVNSVVPGSGRLMMGEPLRAGGEALLVGSSFAAGYLLAGPGPFTIDGVQKELPLFDRNRNRQPGEANLAVPIYSEILQEIGLKSHMTFAFLSYRDAAKQQGVTEGIDQSPASELFLSPFKFKNLTNPWVYIPILAVLAATVWDYTDRLNNLDASNRITPYSNFLYSMNYQVVQPIGSGAPEEMFYRGFLQNEMKSFWDTPWFYVPVTAAAFAFSHAPGAGRITAGISGLYLGYLAHRNDGDLKPGITVHFWSSLVLGIETVFLFHRAQNTTPPAALQIQLNY